MLSRGRRRSLRRLGSRCLSLSATFEATKCPEAQPWQAARFPVVVENLIAGASGSQSSATPEEESQDGQLSECLRMHFGPEIAQNTAFLLLLWCVLGPKGCVGLRTGAHCMWQMDAHAVFPHGTCAAPLLRPMSARDVEVWPAIFMTSDGCFSAGRGSSSLF